MEEENMRVWLLLFVLLSGCAGPRAAVLSLPLPPEPKCERMEQGFVPVESPGPGYFISQADMARYLDCFRQYRLGYEVGRSNTEIANRPSK